jgi:type III restriction enzyme
MAANADVPIQPVEKPILCNPYEEPADHWVYDKVTGEANHGGMRRPAGYWYKTERTGSATGYLPGLADETWDDLPLVNALREDVARWRKADYRGATSVTRRLLKHWARPDLARRLFFCQREAVETAIYLAELRVPGRSRRTGFQNFALSDEDLARLLRGEKPAFPTAREDFYPTLVDAPAGDVHQHALVRMACKMATGSGKTVVMAMLISWAFCNRGQNPASREYPNAVLVVCPNLTVKERLQVLRPDVAENYYEAFDLVPTKLRPLLAGGKVLVTNWHAFAPESEHSEGGASYTVVNKGQETGDAFARRVLGDLYDRMPIMVLNDEGHHCWRPALLDERLAGEEAAAAKAEREEATVWIDGLDRINNANAGGDGKPGILMCVDTSATPFYIHGSGYPEGRPFPWIVSDFGLVDAIESGIVKIPRLPVSDTTGRPDPKYFRLWRAIDEAVQPAERLPGKARKPKPHVVFREAEGALKQIAGQWVERFRYIQEAAPGKENVPPVLIIVCDNTDIAEVFYREISGEREEDIVTEADVEDAAEEEENGEATGGAAQGRGKKKPKRKVIYGRGSVFPEHFSNTPAEKRTIRIDTKLLAEAESEDPKKTRQTFAEELRRVVATVGKPGLPGEKVRCVVSVGMLTEGWDASNVTHVLGIRAFGSQLLCEQVVGRGLRRMDYMPDPQTGMLTEEYVDVYGIPFTVIPFKGRPTKTGAPEDKPKNHVRALEERKAREMRFPVVEGYAFALRRNLIKCDVGKIDRLTIEPYREPTATFLLPTAGYRVGAPSKSGPFSFDKQDRHEYYSQTHVQTIKFMITQMVVDRLTVGANGGGDARRRVMRLMARHQLFPQVYRYVDEYVDGRVDFDGENPCELGLKKYVERTVERLSDAIEPNDGEGEPPLLPVLSKYKPLGTTAEVDFKTTRPCRATQHSHINQVVLDAETWEATTTFRLEEACMAGTVAFYARNDNLGLVIPYEYQGVDHGYEPDFLVRLASGVTVVLEIKGYEDDEVRAKHTAARRWVSAVNNWGQLGRWEFHVCREPQQLRQELKHLLSVPARSAGPKTRRN